MNICIPPWRWRTRGGASTKVCMPSWKQTTKDRCIDKDLCATMKTKGRGSVDIDLHPTTEMKDERGGMVLMKGAREMWWR